MPRVVSNARYAVTEDFRVGDSFIQTQTNPVIAALDGGGFVAVWGHSAFGNSTVLAQIFDRNGREVGDEFVVGQGPESIQPAVASLASGGFVVSWTVGTTGFDVVGQVYDSAGATVGSQFVANTTTSGFQYESRLAGLAGGGFVVTWQNPNDATSDDVRGQVFAADGVKVGGEFIATDALPGDKLDQEAIGLAGGGFVICWFQSGAEIDGGNLSPGSRAQLFDASGNKVGSAFSLNTIVPGSQENPDLAALPSGGFVAAWSDNGNPNAANKGIWIQLFDAAGAKVGAAIQVSTGADAQDVPDVEIIPGVGIVVTWRDSNLTVEEGNPHLRAQILDFSGNETGEEFSINLGLDATQLLPDLTVLESGALVVGWLNRDAPQFNDDDARARILFPTTSGTTGDDVMTGTVDRDFLLGLDGNDQLSGGGEDDGLDGGIGNDVLIGGGGNDELDGGVGVDSMSGGIGNDRYFVDDVGDTIIEAASEGTDAVYVSVSFALAANSEIETLAARDPASSAALNLTGNALANAIVGNAGANILIGGGGADRLAGLGGNDLLIVDSADDVVEEGAGNGFDYVVARASYVLTAGAYIELLSTDNNDGTAAINLSGNALGQVIVGNAGANIIDGGGGTDRLAGLGGNDTYFVDSVDDYVDEAADNGFDYVVARSSYVLTFGASIELMSTDRNAGTFSINLTGNALGQVIVGNAGANVIDGGGGTDRLAGLGGDDTYFVDSLDDYVDEADGGGQDYVAARVSYVLTYGSHVELLSTDDNSGTASINLTGNALAQVIVGNAGANVIDGGYGGADRLAGLGGNDTYLVDGDDLIVESGGGGYDYLASRTSYVLDSTAEIELMSTDSNAGTAAIDLTGNSLGQVIVGNAGANVLNGRLGNDVLEGLGGADTFAFTTDFDQGNNIDRIVDFAAEDVILLDNSHFTGLAAGALPASAFVAGTAAADADDRIVYDAATGRLWFDPDGAGGLAQVQFATLDNHFALTASDFTVI